MANIRHNYQWHQDKFVILQPHRAWGCCCAGTASHSVLSLCHMSSGCTWGTAEPWFPISEGGMLYLQTKKPLISTSCPSPQTWTDLAHIDASAQLLITTLCLFHSAVEKICLDFTAGADGNLIVNQHCRKSSWTQTPHLKSFSANMFLPTSS